ncbi:thiol S-methyltransferase METTL7B [Peromyscus californicus insignis]|uniref:thiol S-methyltransferase METTL7B n=1 Tax=Peromyscus californicus insignis TaxID=564181 RepID=UPI0022A6B305|nr:thiol S-methyltransferase METTL7B [Peromyscus californicus insignis]
MLLEEFHTHAPPRKEDYQAGVREQSPAMGGRETYICQTSRGKKPVSRDAPARAGIMDVLVPFLQLLVLLLTLPLHLLALLGYWQPMCKTYFPYLMAKLTKSSNKKMEGKKRELFSQISDLKGTSGKVALLELGCGTGANFQFYPSDCKVTCVDPNPNFEKFLTKSMAENRHLQYERFIVAYGEDMKQLADGSMDVVVCTLVLCSVQSPKKVLQEIQRVLKPVSKVARVWAWGR